MPSSTARRLAGKVQAWSPALASIGSSIEDNLPRSSEDVKQKLRSWNKSIGKHFRNRRFSPGDASGETPHIVEDQQKQASLDLSAARRAVAENAKAAKNLEQSEKLGRRDSHIEPSNKSKAYESVSRLRNATSTAGLRATSPKSSFIQSDKFKSTSAGVRTSLPTPIHSKTSRLRDPHSSGPEAHKIPILDQKYRFRFSEAPLPSPSPSAAAPAPILRHSASASNLADHVFDSVKKFRRSASNVSLRRKFSQSTLTEDAAPGVPAHPLRYSAPPSGRPNSIQRSYASLNFMHPDQCEDFRKPALESIAENGEGLRPCTDVIREDMIFALHESRTCSPQASPTCVERLPFNHSSTTFRQRDSINKQERPSLESRRRLSSQQSSRSSITSVQLAEQLDRLGDMVALRTSINKSRVLRGVRPLLFYQDLCADAKIVATTYEMVYGVDGGSWDTSIKLHEDAAVLELVGPPGIGGRVTGKMWADGAYSRHTHGSHAEVPLRDHEGCQCHNFKVWEAISDARWRAIGLSRTENGERWVVVLSE